MNHFEQLLDHLMAGKAKDSPEVLTCLTRIRETSPESHAKAIALVDKWTSRGAAVAHWLMQPSTLLGGGFGVAGVASLASAPFSRDILGWLERNYPLPIITSPTSLLLMIAGLGALAGAIYSVYCHRGVVWPQLAQREGVLTLSRFGILNEISFGALAAVTTIWLVVVGLVPPDPSTIATAAEPAAASTSDATSKSETPAPPGHNLVSYTVVAGALLSGWLGARMRSFRLNTGLLTETLARTAVTDKLPAELADQIRQAPDAARAAKLATGLEVVGARLTQIVAEASETKKATDVPVESPPSSGAPPSSTTVGPSLENQPVTPTLFRFFDPQRTRTAVEIQGPLQRDSTWPTLDLLRGLDNLAPLVRDVLAPLKISDLAGISREELGEKCTELGLNPERLAPALNAIHKTVRDAQDELLRQSEDWRWPA